MNMGRCKQCATPIVWARTRRETWMPLDPETVDEHDLDWVSYEGRDIPLFDAGLGHEPHFASCSAADRSGAGSKNGARNGERSGARRDADAFLSARGSSAEYYRALQVMEGAHQNVVRAAYRALAALHHPDAGGNTADMQRINVAYEALQRLGLAT